MIMRKSYIRLHLFGLLLLIVVSAKAQTDFRKSYVITNNSDTIYGFIDYRSELLNCNKCMFKIELEDESISYLPGEIKAYRFYDSKYYVSSFIDELEKDVFLEYLIDGIVDVYYYKEFYNSYYYVSKESSELYKLNNEIKEIEINGVKYAKESNEYIGILKYLFSDSKMYVDKVNNVRIGHKSLINIANDYHQQICSDKECIVFEKKLSPVRFEFSGLILSDFSNLEFTEQSYNYGDFKYGIDVGYSLGLGISAYLPRLNERISVYLQLLYCNNNFNSSVVTEDSYHKFYNYSEMTLKYINRTLGFKYTFPKGKVRPEFILGISKNIMLNTNDERIVDDECPAGVINTFVYKNELLLNYSGYTIGLGLNIYKLKNTDLNLNLQYNFLYNEFPGMFESESSKYKSLKFGFGIKF